jgi:hypothetical protein
MESEIVGKCTRERLVERGEGEKENGKRKRKERENKDIGS